EERNYYLIDTYTIEDRPTQKMTEITGIALKDRNAELTAITRGVGEQITILKESVHSHASNQDKVNAELVTQRMKRITTEYLEIPPAQELSGRRELPKESINLEDLGEIPNCYKITLAGKFQKEKADAEASIAQLSLGQSVKAKPKEKWVSTNERIRNIVLDYDQYKEYNRTLDYLRCIGHNFYLQLIMFYFCVNNFVKFYVV
ncbi:hypothetical protein ANN_12727, partial [Periplaneta americana]